MTPRRISLLIFSSCSYISYLVPACPVDQYKVVSGNTNCTACPGNSWTRNVTGQTWCVCRDGFYRAAWESAHAQCTGEYSSTVSVSASLLIVLPFFSFAIRSSKPDTQRGQNLSDAVLDHAHQHREQRRCVLPGVLLESESRCSLQTLKQCDSNTRDCEWTHSVYQPHPHSDRSERRR